MTNKNDTWIEIVDEDGNVINAFHWPYCAVDGCYNRIKLGVSDLYCHPHSGGKTADKLIQKLNMRIKEKDGPAQKELMEKT